MNYHRALSDLLQATIEDMRPGFGGGLLSVSEYDTGWLARLRMTDNPDELRYICALEWLMLAQNPDGSWSQPYPHNIIPTISVVSALLDLPNALKPQTAQALQNGLDFLAQKLPVWTPSTHESVGLEMLLPFYLAELAAHGVNFHTRDEALIFAQMRQKLLRSGKAQALLRGGPLVHSIEALISHLDPEVMRQLLRPQGHVGNSVSATVSWVMCAGDDPRAIAWLDSVVARYNGVAPVAFPIDVLECAWVLLMLHPVAHLLDEGYVRTLMNRLDEAMTPEGVGWCQNAAIAPDGDDTSVALALRGLYRQPQEPAELLKFEMEQTIASWTDERTASVSTNAHALEAALVNNTSPDARRLADKAAGFLLRARDADGSYSDKWHLSRTYPVHCVIMAFSRHPDLEWRKQVLPSVRWLLEQQKADGSWGDWVPCAEDTALAVIALSRVADMAEVAEPMRRGKLWLQEHYADPRPQQYIGKQLFLPDRIVEAEVLSALLLEIP